MFKVSPRYLSGVSVFYGDDITRRETDGELVVFVGQAQKGPSVPITLKSVDNALPIYGIDNPLVKAIYEFWDGYSDSGATVPLKIVALRIGGQAATLVTSLGVTLATQDSYTTIENDYYVYIDNSDVDGATVKAWDKNKLIVLDTLAGVNTGHITVTGTLNGAGGIYGVDIDNDPLADAVTFANFGKLDVIGSRPVASIPALTAGASTIAITADDAQFAVYPTSGTLVLTGVNGAFSKTVYAPYSSVTSGTKTFNLTSPLATADALTAYATVTVGYVASTTVLGDSQLDLSNRKKYELFRNALLDVETFTPDYIIPGGVAYNATETYNGTVTANTVLKTNVTDASLTALVDAAATWPATGTVEFYNGEVSDKINYSAKAITGADFTLTFDLGTFTLTGDLAISDELAVITGAKLAALPASGYVKLTDGATTETVFFTRDSVIANQINFATPLANAYDLAATTVAQVPGAHTVASTLVKGSWTETKEFELGIGYVQEIDKGDHFEFHWATSNAKETGHYLAHFGYLFANFCNEASVGYNTPLCGMNVALPTSFDRTSVVEWIGTVPTYQITAGTTDAIERVRTSGTGLLGDATLAGSANFNRCYMSNPANNEFADPAYGLLMTDEGFVDGHEIKDTYYKVVDLGKFLCVGAGLLTFNNRAKGFPYTDTCGIYAIGLLAGKPKNEGISFAQIGKNSNVSVGTVVSRKLYNDLAGLGYIVITREKGLGWVINNDNSVARNQSGYYLISTTRTIKAVIEKKRALLVGFIGKPINTYYFEAARTKLADSFKSDIADGYLNGYDFDLQVADTARAIGKLYLKCVLNPPLELVQVDIDTVIDRNITTAA